MFKQIQTDQHKTIYSIDVDLNTLGIKKNMCVLKALKLQCYPI